MTTALAEEDRLKVILEAGLVACEVDLHEARPGLPDRGARLFLTWGSGGKASMYCMYTSDPAVSDALLSEVADLLPARARTSAAAARALESRDKAESACKRSEEKLRAVLTGRLLFGQALVHVEPSGVVWLWDPEKKDRGFGLWFDSLATLWREFPALRPVRWGEEGGKPFLIVEAFRMEAP